MSVVLLWIFSELAVEGDQVHRHLIFESAKEEASLSTVDFYQSKEECRSALMEYAKPNRAMYIAEGRDQLTLQYKFLDYDVYLFCTAIRVNPEELSELK
jgi:hypothetical protein